MADVTPIRPPEQRPPEQRPPEQRPPDTCHHFRTLPTECGHYVAHCVVCDFMVGGLFLGPIPDCAHHWHPEND